MRVLAVGFDFSTTSLNKAFDSLIVGGASDVSWFLPPNRAASVGQVLVRRGVPVYSATISDGVARASPPPETPDAENDLRFLIDRDGRFKHAWDSSLALEVTRQRTFDVLRHVEPDVLVFGEVPHSASMYLLYRLARTLGIPTVVLRWGPTPMHVSAVSSIDERLIDEIQPQVGASPIVSRSSLAYIRTLRGTYSAARPAYSQDSRLVLARVKARIQSRNLTVQPRLLAAMASRQRLRRSLDQLTIDLAALEGKVLSVFLHMQPERTTCPEGGRYVQQWLMISELSNALSEGWTLAVREHPLTFGTGPRLVQTLEFYQAAVALGNVQLVKVDESPFDLVGRSEAVATVTGTIGLEAAARGKPALVFGNAPYRGCEAVIDAGGVHGIPDLNDLAKIGKQGMALESFLAAFDSSAITWAAEWRSGFDVRRVAQSGEPFTDLLPRVLAYYVS